MAKKRGQYLTGKKKSRGRNLMRDPKADRDIQLLLYPERTEHLRPLNRSDCIDGPRPCPFVSCKYNLYLDINAKGHVQINFPGIEPHEMTHSCALDVADSMPGRDRDGKLTLEAVGSILDLTRERIRQIEANAAAKIRSDEELPEALPWLPS